MHRDPALPAPSSRPTSRTAAGLIREYATGTLAYLRGAAFWLAVALPWLLLGLSVTGVLTNQPALFTILVAGTVLCAVLGQDHAR